MSEPLNNLRFSCEAHAPKPMEKKALPTPESLIGHFVKVGFPAMRNGKETKEHMWVKVSKVGLGPDSVVGVLDNDPVLIRSMRCGDTITVPMAEIEEILHEC